MTDYDYDALATETDDDDSGIKSVRAALKARNKELKALADELSTLKSERRADSLSSLLTKVGVDPSVAQDMRDVEPTEDAVKAWLDARPYIARAQGEQAEEPKVSTTPESSLPPDLVAQFQASQQVQTQAESPETALGYAKLLEGVKEAQAKGPEAFREYMVANGLMTG